MSSAPTNTHKTFLADLARLVGPSHLLTDPAKTQRYRKGFRLLVREKGSIGKAYQYLRRNYKLTR